MKLLFLLDSVDFPLAVNPQLARRLAGQLVRMGHKVELLWLWDGVSEIPAASDGVQIHTLAFADEFQMNRCLENGRKNGSPTLVRLFRLAGHPAACIAAFRQLILHKNHRQVACTKTLEQLDTTNHYDAVIAVCAPYHVAFALADAKINARKFTWQMDPFSANEEYVPFGGAEKELAMYAKMEHIFITQLMRKDYEAGPLAVAKSKTGVLEFPCLVPAEKGSSKASHSGIRCVFAGSLHPEIRTPFFALALFAALDDPEVTLVMVGGGWENFDSAQIAQYKKKLGARLEITGALPPEAARQKMAEADILLNLGNSVANQLPSKIFDYFGAGKPVLNLCVRADDPTLSYFARWPLAKTVMQGPISDSVCRELGVWLHETAGKRIAFEQAAKLYAQNTPAAVAEQLLKTLNNTSEKNT